MRNVKVGLMNATTLKVCADASKIEVRIDKSDVLEVLLDGGYVVNAKS